MAAPGLDIYPATTLDSPEQLRAVLNSAVTDPFTREPAVDDIEAILAAVPRSAADLVERYCAVARDPTTAQVLGMMTLKHPDGIMRSFAVTDNPVEIDDAYALTMRSGIGTALVEHVESVARDRGHTELVLVSGPRFMTRGWHFWTKLYGEPVGTASNYFEGTYDGKVWRKPLPDQE